MTWSWWQLVRWLMWKEEVYLLSWQYNVLDRLQIYDIQAWNTLLSTLKVSSSIGGFSDKDYVEQEHVEELLKVHNYDLRWLVFEYKYFGCCLWIWYLALCIRNSLQLVDCFLYFGFVSSTSVLHKTGWGGRGRLYML